jgi:hypothetical protein
LRPRAAQLAIEPAARVDNIDPRIAFGDSVENRIRHLRNDQHIRSFHSCREMYQEGTAIVTTKFS